jgi:hypothetical protein
MDNEALLMEAQQLWKHLAEPGRRSSSSSSSSTSRRSSSSKPPVGAEIRSDRGGGAAVGSGGGDTRLGSTIRLRKTLVKMLLSDVSFALANEIDKRLWGTCFYAQISA